MPTYDYECQACGHKFEEFQSIKAPPIKTCPVCRKNKVRRLIGAGGGLIFKGSGFYCTDYRDSGRKTESKAETPASADTKPAATEVKESTTSPADGKKDTKK
jgi:putative FmdB family regulatory protein